MGGGCECVCVCVGVCACVWGCVCTNSSNYTCINVYTIVSWCNWQKMTISKNFLKPLMTPSRHLPISALAWLFSKLLTLVLQSNLQHGCLNWQKFTLNNKISIMIRHRYHEKVCLSMTSFSNLFQSLGALL
jgi:hypothetical protein